MEPVNILQFPNEILEKIFGNCSDATLTIAAGVCRRFNNSVNNTIRRKYNGENNFYQIEILDSSMENAQYDFMQHRPFILKRVSSIKLIFRADVNTRSHWINRVLEIIGPNIKMIRLKTEWNIRANFCNILAKTPNISHLKICTDEVVDEIQLKPFVKCVQILKLEAIHHKILSAFNSSILEELKCTLLHEDIVDMPSIQMPNLKKLRLYVPKGALNEIIIKIVASAKKLRDLCLSVHENTENAAEDNLTEQSMDILSNLSSLEKFECGRDMRPQNIASIIGNVRTLVSIVLWHETFTIGDYRVLLKEANKNASLRRIHFGEHVTYEYSLLRWIMDNINEQIRVDYTLNYKLAVSKGKVQFEGVTTMSSNESTIDWEKITEDWLQQIEKSPCWIYVIGELFSHLPIPIMHARFNNENLHIYLDGDTNEAEVKRKGKHISKVSTVLSGNDEESVIRMNWLEKYCPRLQQFSIYIDNDVEDLPTWTFPELKVLRVRCYKPNEDLVDITPFFASLKCHLSSLELVGSYQLTNVQVVSDVDLFDHLVDLQIFSYSESAENLLEKFNRNVKRNLRQLTLVNTMHGGGERYKMNNKTITAISRYTNLLQLRIMLPRINETTTKNLFENCTKLSELLFECNFLSIQGQYSYILHQIFADIKSNCNSLAKLHLVWHGYMMEPSKVHGINGTFPGVFVKIMQLDYRMQTTAEQIIDDRNPPLEQLFDKLSAF